MPTVTAWAGITEIGGVLIQEHAMMADDLRRLREGYDVIEVARTVEIKNRWRAEVEEQVACIEAYEACLKVQAARIQELELEMALRESCLQAKIDYHRHRDGESTSVHLSTLPKASPSIRSSVPGADLAGTTE